MKTINTKSVLEKYSNESMMIIGTDLSHLTFYIKIEDVNIIAVVECSYTEDDMKPHIVSAVLCDGVIDEVVTNTPTHKELYITVKRDKFKC